MTLSVVGWFLYLFVGPNRHAVIAGKVYRSSQPSGETLSSLIRANRVRTVLNLRGFCPGVDWYEEEMQAVYAGDANLEDVTMSAKCLPTPGEVRRVIDIYDHAEFPILIHCKEGKDRTGLVSAMALLLYTDATVEMARRQLLPIYGHLQVGRTVAMDDFFDRYEAWLLETKQTHSPATFREWATNYYVPGVGRAEITLISPKPENVKPGTALNLTVRVTNRSHDVWEFKPGSTAAIHLGYVLVRNGTPIFEEKAGLFQRTVAPGEALDLQVVTPPIREPGEYLLKLEMQDYRGAGISERASAFSKYGDDPCEIVFHVK
ncbi:MAG: tyrosine-protein phosphatase [Gemmataceae bacterium]